LSLRDKRSRLNDSVILSNISQTADKALPLIAASFMFSGVASCTPVSTNFLDFSCLAGNPPPPSRRDNPCSSGSAPPGPAHRLLHACDGLLPGIEADQLHFATRFARVFQREHHAMVTGSHGVKMPFTSLPKRFSKFCAA